MRLIAAIANGLNFLFFLFLIGNSRANEFPRRGGTLIISLHSEPKTLNPLVVSDTSSRGIVGLISADLIHINNFSQQTEPALASSWEVTEGGRRYMLHLRQGVRFSDGAPFDADDVLFSFRSYLDERVQSPQRDLLIISGKPILVQKIDAYTVVFTLARPYAAAERLFDGIAMLPRHLLEARLAQGTLQNAWTTGTPPAEIAGLGPFRLKEYVPGQHLVLERNPYYWKRDQGGQQLPYLDRIA
ncbi:MAG TPA: ABC transporter substrate-binding protein, partial [Bryobacteraceae bacterium]